MAEISEFNRVGGGGAHFLHDAARNEVARLVTKGPDAMQVLQDAIEVGEQFGGRARDTPRSGSDALRNPKFDLTTSLGIVKNMLSRMEKASLEQLAHTAGERSAERVEQERARQARVADYAAGVEAMGADIERFGASMHRLAQIDASGKALDEEIARLSASLLPKDQSRMLEAARERESVGAQRASAVEEARTDGGRAAASADVAGDRFRNVRSGAPLEVTQREESRFAKLLMLFAQFGELVAERGEKRFEIESARVQALQDDRAQKIQDELKRVEQENEKAAELNKTAGCIGKIVGAVVTAIATVGAAFTGGASLAVAGIGLALMATDAIVKAATGTSFMAEVLNPLMNVLQPVLDFLSGAVADLLREFGVSEHVAQMIAMVAVSVAVAAAVVALSASGAAGAVSNAVGRLGSLLAKGIERTVGKMIPEALKHAVFSGARRLASGTSRMVEAAMERLGMSTDAISRQAYGHRMTLLSVGTAAVGSSAEGGLNIAAEVHNVEMTKARVLEKQAVHEYEMLTKLMQMLADMIGKTMESGLRIRNTVSQVVSKHEDANLSVTRKIAVSLIV
ncbi:type III secretion system translocon subunit SctE [Burkholderia semiarida]|uniref:Translocator protein BipB n=1 Tax=Burkholderia semiarida TaxID=2843303 RepID=A0ABW7LD72_9BURK